MRKPRKRIAAFLATELGLAFVAAFVAFGLSRTAVPPRLAKELRVRALSGAGDAVLDLAMEPMRSVVAEMLRGVVETPERIEKLPEPAVREEVAAEMKETALV